MENWQQNFLMTPVNENKGLLKVDYNKTIVES